MRFSEFAEMIESTKKTLEFLEKDRDKYKLRSEEYFRELYPDIAKRMDENDLDGEIRLLREQG